jgi:hypothetical protein
MEKKIMTQEIIKMKYQKTSNLPNEFARKLRWVASDILVNPIEATELLNHTCAYGKKTFIHGYHISTTDLGGNTFIISWLSGGKSKQWKIVFPANGTVSTFEEYIAINELSHADPQSALTISCLNAGDGDYQVALCIAEEVL